MSGGVYHAAAGGNHIINDDDILTVDIVPQKFMRNDRVLAVHNGGVIPAFVEHTGVHTEDVCKIHSPVKRSFIGADHNGVVLVDNQILLHSQESADKLVGRCEIVKALDGHGILYSWVMGIKCDKVGDTHIHQFFDGIGTV